MEVGRRGGGREKTSEVSMKWERSGACGAPRRE